MATMIRSASTTRLGNSRRVSQGGGDYECKSAPSRSTLRLFMIFVSLTWTTYVFWMQRYVELDHRKTTFTTSLQDFLVDIPYINTKMAVEAVFYHIIIPETEEESMYTSRIVAQQLEQMTSASVKYVYYTTQGPLHHDLVANKAFLQGICRRLDLICHHKGHVQSETESLGHLHEYCTNAMHDEYNDGTNRLVSYIHSSPRVVHAEIPVNRRLRNILTESALSEECTTALRQEDQCNVCGLLFTSQHTLHYPGNMWSASCQYIEKLIKPTDFSEALQEVIGEVLVRRLSRDTMTNLYPDSKLGLGESIMEHWIASHPELMPCDVGSDGEFKNYLKQEYTEDDLSWRQAPRRPVREMIAGGAKDTVLARTVYRLREYYLLPGNIMKWRGLYGSLPTPDSYVWDVFPDGTFWKLATEKYGLGAPESVVQASSMALSGQDLPPHLPDTAPLFAPSTGDINMDLTADLTVFYDVYIPTATDSKQVPKDMDLIQQQIRAMTEATRGVPVAVYYHTMGHEALVDLDLCADETQLECRLLQHYDKRYQGETIRQLSQPTPGLESPMCITRSPMIFVRADQRMICA